MIDVIGRADEAAATARFVDGVLRGPAGLLIEGEPGIGKTTVLLEAIRQARGRGFNVLDIRPAEAEAELSFAALADLLGDTFDVVGQSLPAPQRRALEVALLRREAVEPADPRTTATALLTVVTLLSRRDPLVIAIDDAQWTDHPSRRALAFVARRLPAGVGMLIATRTGSRDAGDLVPTRFERVAIEPLSLASLHHLLQARLGVKPPRPLLVRIAEASGGNPLYALEIASALSRSAALPAASDPLPGPGSLHDLLSERIARLSVPARQVASAAAALSRPTTEALEAAFGSDIDVEAALLEAEDAGIVVSEADRLRFSHPLLASTLYRSLTPARGRTLHRRLASVVAEPEERARHLARSASAPDDAAAITIEEAAALATRRGAPESAAELYEAAARLTPDEESDNRPRRLLGAANALLLAGDLEGARAHATEASASGRTPSTRARALLLLGDVATYTDSIESRLDYQERALAEAGTDRDLRVEILLALFEEIATDPERAGARADAAVELLRGGTDGSALARALVCKFIAEAVLGRGARRELLDEALRLEAEVSGPISAYPLLWFHWIDDLEAARARFRLLDQRYADQGDAVAILEIVEFIAMAEFRAGNWPEAERALGDACDTLAQFELRGPVVASFADRSVIDAHRGRIERARRTVEDLLEPDGLDLFWQMVCHSAQGAVEFCAGNNAAADRAWTAMRAEAELVGWIDFLDDRSEPDNVETLIALGRLDEARRVLEHLEWRGRTLPRPWIDATLPRARALVLAATGDVAGALSAIDSSRPIDSLPFERARLLLARGQLERRANRKLAARDSLTEALGAFESLGSPPWEQRTRDEIARIGLRHRGPTELTETERRIAELAATGMTNRQVADAAFVSPKTVEANLARVYRKLGIGSRAELGARMTGGSGAPETQT